MTKLSKFQKLNIYAGMVFIFSSVAPVSILFKRLFGGMYGPVFKNFSPAIYRIATLFITYTVVAFIIYIIFKKLDVMNRINTKYASTTLFAIGNIILSIYIVIRIYTSTIQGGGPSMVISMYGIYPVTIAKILLSIAIVRTLLSAEPWPEFEASTNSHQT